MQSMQRVRASFVLAAGLVVAGCGGGGGSPSSPSPPPPPPGPATVVNATTSAASIQEGQPFTLTASGSTTNGSALTFAWAQVSGPAVSIANASSTTLNLNAAEVTADTAAQFRVTMTAGPATATATVDVTFANIAQTPALGSGSQTLATATFSVPVRKVMGEFNYGLAGIANGPNDPLTFLDFSLSPSNQLQVAPSQLESLPRSVIMRPSLTLPGAGTERYFTVIEEDMNRLRILTRSTTGTIATKADLALSRPCGFTHTTTTIGAPAYYVGQRSGFAVVSVSSVPTVLRSELGAAKPFCALVAPNRTIAGDAFTAPTPGISFWDVIALDTDTNSLNLLSHNAFSSTPLYLVTQQVPVQLNATKPLTLAAWSEIGLFGGIGFTTGMALVFTDGTHNGEHRLVLVGFDASHTLVQQTYNLGLGVPIEVFTDSLDGDTLFPEIVVVKSTSPQVEVYETTVTTGGATQLSGPRFLEIGLGASSAFRSLLLGLNGITVAFPDKKEVKVIGVLP